ncbi:acyltransferase family protein [Hymenobacter bucti]|uniref:Acyltransferase family protein n=1 Tax=Hymenobacter bucti TaxID=1844114 RepID=A0ABW4QUG5_9BACT
MKTELSALTGLRALAALMVFAFHVHLRNPMLFLPWSARNLVSQGALGVTVFFVLSGFLLTYSHLPDFAAGQLPTGAYFKRFMRKRLARIYPAYLAGLLLFGVTVAATHSAAWQLAWPTVVADLTMTQTLFPSLAMDWYGTGAWSISTEICFYLSFPLLLPLLLRISSPRLLKVLLAIIILVGAGGGMAYQFWPARIGYSLMYTHPLFRGSEFIAGMLAGVLVFRFQWRVSEWAALGLVGIASVYIAERAYWLEGFVAHNWLVVPAIVSLVAALADAPRTKVLRLLAHPWLVYAGRLSYCFYLAQLPFFVLQDIQLEAHQPLTAWWWSGPAVFGATTVVAVLLHHGVELPAHRWLLPKGQKLPVTAKA